MAKAGGTVSASESAAERAARAANGGEDYSEAEVRAADRAAQEAGEDQPRLAIRYVPLDSLIPYVNNARTHSESQISQIAASIKEFGFNAPILVDGDRGIVAGHGRAAAARKLGMTEVPVVELSHLSDTQRRAYILADNRIALNAGYDTELLKLELSDLSTADFDVKLLGFDEMELRNLFGDDPTDKGPPDEFGAYDEDIETEHQCPACGYAFSSAAKPKKKGGSTIDNPPRDDFPDDE